MTRRRERDDSIPWDSSRDSRNAAPVAKAHASDSARPISKVAPFSRAVLPRVQNPKDLQKRQLAGGQTNVIVGQCIPAAALILLDSGLDYRDAMTTTFRAGGDTDSIGSIVGSVIGAQVGESGLPREWAEAVQRRDYLRRLADELAASEQGRSPLDSP